jgi:hypothetical protein
MELNDYKQNINAYPQISFELSMRKRNSNIISAHKYATAEEDPGSPYARRYLVIMDNRQTKLPT